MNRWIRSAVALAVLAVAACSDTSSDSPLAPTDPRFNSGLISTGNSAAPAASDSTSTERSGLISTGN
jgi:ABC-type phosphate/phosphonate transport system substrate-binding protein